ncbi:MAG TPA: superoxide dismutase family protein [Patescibacteria group bacterium]|nr:superoxide dismutase family protein [Patescibacteria group bacterium]
MIPGKKTSGFVMAAILALGLTTSGCERKEHVDSGHDREMHGEDDGKAQNEGQLRMDSMNAVVSSPTQNTAMAVLSPTQGNTVAGTISFTQVSGGVQITGNLQGLPPNSTHGFHVHEKGDCSAADGSSAGGHFNPDNHQHGGPDDQMRHVGDLGNVQSDASGNARYERLVPGMTLEGANSIIGRGLIVHKKADDFKTQPTGGAGDRIACGVIQKAGTVLDTKTDR